MQELVQNKKKRKPNFPRIISRVISNVKERKELEITSRQPCSMTLERKNAEIAELGASSTSASVRPPRKTRVAVKRSFRIKDLPPEEYKKYRAECSRQWRKNNKERYLKFQRTWVKLNRDKTREYNRAYWKKLRDAWRGEQQRENQNSQLQPELNDTSPMSIPNKQS